MIRSKCATGAPLRPRGNGLDSPTPAAADPRRERRKRLAFSGNHETRVPDRGDDRSRPCGRDGAADERSGRSRRGSEARVLKFRRATHVFSADARELLARRCGASAVRAAVRCGASPRESPAPGSERSHHLRREATDQRVGRRHANAAEHGRRRTAASSPRQSSRDGAHAGSRRQPCSAAAAAAAG